MSRICFAVALVLVAGCAQDKPSPPVNVLVYLVDTLRADTLGATGHPVVQTPHIDAFAREGTIFENAYANSTWTRASVASLLTGRYPIAHGARTRRSVLVPGTQTLASILSAHGYATGFVSTNPNVASVFGFDQGFDDMIELYDRKTSGYVEPEELIATADDVTRRGLDWIDATDRPFLLVLHTTDPHDPYDPPKAFDIYLPAYRGDVDGDARKFRKRRLTQADRQRVRSLYLGEISFNDQAFGDLLTGLRERGLEENTLVVFTSDHGEELWEEGPMRHGHGFDLGDAQLRIPFVLRFPASARVGRGVRDRRIVQGVDLIPTILDLSDLPSPNLLDGRSVLASEPTPEAFASLELSRRRLHSVVDADWKLVWDAHSDRTHLAPAGDHSPPGDPEVIERRLRLRLEEYLERGPLDPVLHIEHEASDLPEGVREGLRALGYIE